MREQQKLYDDAYLMKEEYTAWGWSPLYQAFLRDFPKTGPSDIRDTLRKNGRILCRPCNTIRKS